MARPIERLSAIALSKLAKRTGKHCDGGGLYLHAEPPSQSSWLFRYRLAGKARWMGLGPYPAVSLADARTKAADCRRSLANKVDPIVLRETRRKEALLEAAKAMTFKQCAEAYVAAHKIGWRNAKHRAQWDSTLKTYAYPILGDLSVSAINTGLVAKVLEPIWTTKPDTAKRTRGRIEAVIDWATVREYRTGENPARWRGHLEKLLPGPSTFRKVEHHSALPYADIPAFMTILRAQEGTAALALEFAILTAARTSEVTGAQWSEIQDDVWTIPGERMKGGREHRVPLSPRAVAILKQLKRGDSFVFPGRQGNAKPLSNMAFLMLLRRMKRDDLTAHGFRSTFRDWAAETTNFPAEVAEMALAHVVGNKVEAAYRRGDLFDKRRRLMDAWAVFCEGKASKRGQVVHLEAARAG